MKPLNRRIGDSELKSILQSERTSALGSQGMSDLSHQRATALEYYMGKMDDMPANEGESQAVSSDVQDVIEGALPIILDVLTSGSGMCEFEPHGPGDEEAARQETDYVTHVINKLNPGFLITHIFVKDALLQKNGFTKFWMEDAEERTREKYKGLDEDSFAMLNADDAGKVVDVETYTAPDLLTGQPVKYYNAVFERTEKYRCPKLAAVPPEEMLIAKNTRNTLQDATYLCHVSNKPQADVIAAFPDKAEVIKNAPSSSDSPTVDNDEAMRRALVDNDADITPGTEVNKDMRPIEVAEHYIRIALEEDDVARRYKITTVGTGYEILDIEEVDSWPFACGTGIIMSHRLFGRALADLAMDIQQIKTSFLRSVLNNAYYSNNARIEVSETHAGENTLDDILNNRVGGVVRTKMPGGLNAMEVQPIGQWVMPVMDYMTGVRDRRTGVSETNTGLDPDSLNHSRTGAVSRIMDAAEMRIKLIARVIVETWGVDLYRGVHAMLQKYSEKESVVKLRGNWTKVDPREWQNRRHMDVSIPLGGVSRQQLLTFFAQMLGVQKEALQMQGGSNGPLVSLQNIYATCDQMVHLAGLKSAAPYFMTPPPPDPNAPKPPDPKMIEAQGKVQAQQQKTQADIAGAAAKHQAQTQQDAARIQFEQQMALIQQRIDQQNQQQEFLHKQALDRMQFQHEAAMTALQAKFDMQIEAFKADEQAKLNRQQAVLSAKSGANV